MFTLSLFDFDNSNQLFQKKSIICKRGREGGDIMDGQTITGNNNEGDNITKTKIVNHGWGTRPNKTTSITLAFSKTRIQNPLGDA